MRFENLDGGGSIHTKNFELASMDNHLLHGFMGESEPFLKSEWREIIVKENRV